MTMDRNQKLVSFLIREEELTPSSRAVMARVLFSIQGDTVQGSVEQLGLGDLSPSVLSASLQEAKEKGLLEKCEWDEEHKFVSLTLS